MVRAGKVGRTDNDLPVSGPVTWLSRALTHTRSIPTTGPGQSITGLFKATLKLPLGPEEHLETDNACY
jgi:hypothetical protein